MNLKQRRNIMKAFVESQFGYCPLIWMFHSRGLNNKINRIHERALRITYKNKSSTFQELLEKDYYLYKFSLSFIQLRYVCQKRLLFSNETSVCRIEMTCFTLNYCCEPKRIWPKCRFFK